MHEEGKSAAAVEIWRGCMDSRGGERWQHQVIEEHLALQCGMQDLVQDCYNFPHWFPPKELLY